MLYCIIFLGFPILPCRAVRSEIFTTNHVDDLTDCVDHQLRLLLMYFVTAIGVGYVLCVRHQLGEPILRLFLRSIGDVAEITLAALSARSIPFHYRSDPAHSASCKHLA
jgi:hypothetical protein